MVFLMNNRIIMTVSKRSCLVLLLSSLILLGSMPDTLGCEPTDSDIFQCLKILPSASKEEVSKAYRSAALKIHPDKHQKDKEKWTEKVVRLNTLYQQYLKAGSYLSECVSQKGGQKYLTLEALEESCKGVVRNLTCSQCKADQSILSLRTSLCDEFKNSGVYLRKIRRLVDEDAENKGELSFISEKRHNAGDEIFLSSCVIKSGKPISPYDSFPASGFFISSKATLGIWGSKDLASHTKQPELARGKVKEAVKSGMYGAVQVKKSYADVKKEIDKIKSPTSYNEALIDYGLEDILGIYAEVPKLKSGEELNAETVIKSAKQLVEGWKMLLRRGKKIPLVEYHSDGSIQFIRSISDYLEKVHSSYCVGDHKLRLGVRKSGVTTESDMEEEDCQKLKSMLEQQSGSAPIFDIQSPAVSCDCDCSE